MNKLGREDSQRLRKRRTVLFGGASVAFLSYLLLGALISVLHFWLPGLSALMSYVITVVFMAQLIYYVVATIHGEVYARFDLYAICVEWVRFPINYMRYMWILHKLPGYSELYRRSDALRLMRDGHRPAFKKLLNILIQATDKKADKRRAKETKTILKKQAYN